MVGNYKMTYKVDLVLCIDATGSMTDIMKQVKNNAFRLHADILKRMNEKNKKIDQLRVRLIAFRDYIADGDKAMFASEFFTIPEETEKYKRALSLIEPDGGGDIPEDGLEALAYAMRSKWETDSIKKRHVISVWTDAPAHPIGFCKNAPNYPARLPESFEELSKWWGDRQNKGYMDNRAKRLVIFAPTHEESDARVPSYWQRIAENWDNAMLSPVEPGKGLTDYGYDDIIDKICSTI